MRSTGRMRDKITTINYCLKATVLYTTVIVACIVGRS